MTDDTPDARLTHDDLIARIKNHASESAAEHDRIMQVLKADVIALAHEEPDGTGIRPTMAAYTPQDADAFDPVVGLRAGAEYIWQTYEPAFVFPPQDILESINELSAPELQTIPLPPFARDVPPGANAEDCPYCGTDLPYPWICAGHPAAYARAMDLARGEAPAEPDTTEFDQVINEYTRIGEKAFRAARLVDGAGQPIYTDYADWYANGDWHGNEEGDQR